MINAINDHTDKDRVQEQYNMLLLNKFKEECPEPYLKKKKVHPLIQLLYATIVLGWVGEIGYVVLHQFGLL